MTITTIRVESSTLKEFKKSKVKHMADKSLTTLNDDKFVKVLLGKNKKWQQKQEI